MRVDCINECFGEKLKKTKHKCTYSFYIHPILWRNDSAYSSYQDLKLCDYNIRDNDWKPLPHIVTERVKARLDCDVKCRPDFVNRYYKKDTQVYEELGFDYKVPLNTTEINYFHNNMPDQITQHIEEISFVDFFGTFGGLVGVWLGFSIATVISDLMAIIRDKYLRNFNIPF